MIRRHLKIIAVDHGLHGRVVVKDDGGACMLPEMRRAGRRLDDAAAWCEVALQNGERPFGVDRSFHGSDDIGVMHFRTVEFLRPAPARNRELLKVEQRGDLLHQGLEAAGVVEVFHQIGVAARPHIGDHRHDAACRVEVVERDVVPGAPGHGDHMDHRIG